VSAARTLVVAAALTLCALSQSSNAAEPAAMQAKPVKIVDLPGTEGGNGGAMAFDADTKTVWLSQSPNRNLVVFETRGNSVIRVIEGVERPGAIAFDGHFAYIADQDAKKVLIVDKRSYERVGAIEGIGAEPDAVYVEPKRGTVWVAAGGKLSAFERAGKSGFDRVATLPILAEGHKIVPGVGVYVEARRRIFQPLVDGIDVVDTRLRIVDYRIRLDRVGRIATLAYDAKSGGLVAGTDRHAILFVRAATGTLAGVLHVGGAIGEIGIDPGLHRAYGADAAGTIDVVDLAHDTLLGTLPTEPGVHALAVDPTSHLLYVYRAHANKLDVIAPQ
jgi:DNA-binding beta-propeller fold protein YncE